MATQFNTPLFTSNTKNQNQAYNRLEDVIIIDITGV